MRRLAAALLLLAACSKPKPETEEEAIARERRERDAMATGLRAKAYALARDQVPEGEVAVERRTVNASERAALFAVAYALSGSPRLAVFELARVKDDEVPAEERAALHVVRGYGYSQHGWKRLSHQEFMKAVAASAEIMAARDVLEGGPVGELCIALAHAEHGDYEKAADEIDKALARGTFDPATAEKLKSISKELREAKNPMGLLWRLLLERARDAFANERYEGALAKVREKAKGIVEKIRE